MNREPLLTAIREPAAIFIAPRASALPVVIAQSSSDRCARWVDVFLAILVFLLILPVMVLIALAIKCTSPGPVLFAHDRVGRGGRLFACLKFRSMALHADDHLVTILALDPARGAEWAQAHKLRKDPRVTPVGSFLRRTSLDELPQLLNVLRGEMSLVGPRPIVPAEIFRYGRYFDHYCSVLPGITGLWQVNGRNKVRYPRRVALDVLYIRKRSLPLNLGILARTLPCVIMARGIY